ncbi:MAG: tripartite tricarboxylate transporter substrate binding protein [Pseudomonadota bacterium]|nr:tripartite tricarboxylate transporter substrate binding protein [Pseudomonadota bacterium]
MADRLSRRRSLLLAAACTALHRGALAQPAVDNRIVKILVGFPAGQATDTVARLLAERLRTVTGDTYIVENRAGQGGSLALGQLARSPPNGSVMMLAHMSAVATNPHIYQSVPYDSMKDFEAVGLVGDLPFVLVCNASLPIQNIDGLVRYAKANPGRLTNASSGNGTVSHLAMEEFKRKEGLSITHVPYKGSVAGLTDVISGNVSMALETAAAVRPHMESGRLRALAVGSSERLGGVLAVPTLAEQGFPEMKAVTWLMLLYSAGTAATTVRSTFSALRATMGAPETIQKMLLAGLLPRVSSSPEEAAAYLRSEFKSWGEIVRRSNLVRE